MFTGKCRRCGNCCRWHGWVRLSDGEIDVIAEFLGMSPVEFIDRYTVLAGDRRSLSLDERPDGECIFFRDGEISSCMIEPVKPQQCRDFPDKWNFPGWEKECGMFNNKENYPLGAAYIVSGPSGVGKSTLLTKLRESDPALEFSISCTTRSPRGEEVDGREYHFVTPEKFEELVRQGEFLEYAGVFSKRYGTLKSEIFDRVQKGVSVLLDIDVQGAMQIMEAAKNDPLLSAVCNFIFIAPPSCEELERRLRSRATDSEEQISLRLAKAKEEISHWRKYDYTVVNNDLTKAAVELQELVRSLKLASKLWTGERF
jgi:guanylate kinase